MIPSGHGIYKYEGMQGRESMRTVLVNDCLSRMAMNNEESDEAFNELYKEMFRPMYLLAASLIKNASYAEDITQEVFITARKIAIRYRRGSNGCSWLFSITRNLCMHHLRNESAKSKNENTDCDHGYVDSAFDMIVVADALNILNAREREIVVLHVFGGFSLTEFADAIKSSYGTVLWRYHKAKKQLKNYYTERGVSNE